MPVVTNFQFRLNGIIISRLMVRPVSSTEPRSLGIVACHETLGEFAIDDNEALPTPRSRRSYWKCGT